MCRETRSLLLRPDKMLSLTLPWLLVQSLPFPWQLSDSLTFPGFPDKRSPCPTEHRLQTACFYPALSCASSFSFLQLDLKHAAHISFSRSLLDVLPSSCGALRRPLKWLFGKVLTLVLWWLHGTVVERWSLTGKLSLSCTRPAAYVGKPSAVGQLTRPTQPFILSGSINE